LEERNEESIFEALKKNDPNYMRDRYPSSKLLEVFVVRTLAKQINTGPHALERVILNMVNPGFCHSSLSRSVKGFQAIFFWLMKALLARSTEVGSRTLLASAAGGPETHGQYMSDCVVKEPSDFVRSEEGQKTQERVYKELMEILEKIQPGITKNI
jgi:retinol dehydrogenase-12